MPGSPEEFLFRKSGVCSSSHKEVTVEFYVSTDDGPVAKTTYIAHLGSNDQFWYSCEQTYKTESPVRWENVETGSHMQTIDAYTYENYQRTIEMPSLIAPVDD